MEYVRMEGNLHRDHRLHRGIGCWLRARTSNIIRLEGNIEMSKPIEPMTKVQASVVDLKSIERNTDFRAGQYRVLLRYAKRLELDKAEAEKKRDELRDLIEEYKHEQKSYCDENRILEDEANERTETIDELIQRCTKLELELKDGS